MTITRDLLDAPAVFPAPGGGLLWVPNSLPVYITDEARGMTVAEWLGIPDVS